MPGPRCAPSASSANPSPPAAPAPGRRPGPASTSAANRASAASSPATSSSSAPFCRPKTCGGTAQPEQRVVDVTGRDDLDAGHPGPGRGQVDPVEAGQREPAGRRAVGRLGAERGQHAGAAVVGRAAAQADDDPAGALVDRDGEQLAHAVRRGHAPGRVRRGRAGAGRGLADSM